MPTPSSLKPLVSELLAESRCAVCCGIEAARPRHKAKAYAGDERFRV